MAKSDGTLKFDTSLDYDNVVEGVKDISSKTLSLKASIDKTKASMDSLEKKMKELQGAKAPTAEYADYQKMVQQTEASLNRLLAQQELIVNTGGKQRGTTWDRLQYKIEEARNTLAAYKADMTEMETSGTGYETPAGNTEKLAQMQQQYSGLAQKLEVYKAKLSEAQTEENSQGATEDNVSAKTSRLSSHASNAAKKQSLLAKASNKVKSGLSKMSSGMVSATKRLASFVTGLGKGTSSSNMFTSALKRTVRSMLLLSPLRSVFSSLGNVIYSSLKTNDQFVSSLAEIKGNLYTAFQPIYEFVLPAVNALMSGLSKLSGYLAQVTNQLLGKSVSASQAAASAMYEEVQALEDTTDASKEANKQLSGIDELNNTTSSSSSGSSSSSSSDSDTIVPDFSTAIEESTFLTELVDKVKSAWANADFTEVGQTLAAKLNTALQNIPWAEIQTTCQNVALSAATFLNGFFEDPSLFANLGTNIGNGINTAIWSVGAFADTLEWSSIGASLGAGLQSLGETVDWDGIAWDVATIFNGLADAIIAFADGITWPDIGITLGNALNTFLNRTDWEKIATGANKIVNGIIQAAAGFITTFEWDTLGTDIGTMINDFLLNTDWVTLFTGVAGLVMGLLTSITNFMQTMRWGEIASTLINALGQVDWISLFLGAVGLIQSVLDAILSVVQAIQWVEVAGSLGVMLVDAICGIDWISLLTSVWDIIFNTFLGLLTGYLSFFYNIGSELGCHIIDGLAKGINVSEMLSNAWNWIKEHIFNPIVDAVKSLFGINSPSTVFADFGTYIMQGLINGITGLVDKVKEKFSTLVDNIKSFFTNIPTWFKEKFTAALTAIKSAFSLASIKSFFKSIWTAITNVFSNVTGWFKDKFKAAWEAVKNVFSSGGKVFSGIKEGIEDTFKSIVNTLISGINTIIAIPFNSINSMLNTIRNISILGVSPFSGLWSENPLAVPQIPELATGTVVPANYGEFLAMLGDNTRETEVVSPLSTMKEALLEALQEYGASASGANVQLTVQIGKKTIYQEVLDANSEAAKAGRPYLVTV